MSRRCNAAFVSTLALAWFLAAPLPVLAAPEVITVPWYLSEPGEPDTHYTYGGAPILLKGIVRGPATEFRWDFGDGGGTSWAPVADPYALEAAHAYTGIPGEKFIATLYVRDASGEQDSDVYRVKIYESSDLSIPGHLDVRINMSIDAGLWWLHKTMARGTLAGGSPGYGQPYGYWSDPGGYPLAATCTAVAAFQLFGSKPDRPYSEDPYVETVQRALNYMLYFTYSYPIGPQPAGDPDTLPNGRGLVTNFTSNLYDSRQTYIGGICMTAFASSGARNRIAGVGGADVYGRPYGEIVQDMTDFFAWGQVDTQYARGGWRYYANYSGSDMSTTQWPPLAMLAATENSMGISVPDFVADELVLFLNAMQRTSCDSNNGAFAYDPAQTLYNDTKAAAGLICHEFIGTPLSDPRAMAALGFLYRHWNDSGSSWDYERLLGNSYAMYGVMKAMRSPEPDILRIAEYDCATGTQTGNSFDWFYAPAATGREGLGQYIVRTQQADGSWDDVAAAPNPVYDAFSTGWRILTLLPGVTIIPPSALICDCDEQEYNLDQTINLDGACSYHPDPKRHIVRYEWDLDNDGLFDDATGPTASIPGGFPVEGRYPVHLRVTDDTPGFPQTDVYTCEVYVHPPPHCPHAFAGGPYTGWVGTPVTFDASRSWDPDNAICAYDWDLDRDGLYGAEDQDTYGSPSDGVGVTVPWTFDAPREFVVGLRVRDCPGEFPTCEDFDFSVVDIGNHPPHADPNGPYTICPGCAITVDGSASYDIDPGDVIQYAWDLDEDGLFGTEDSPADCTSPTCPFTEAGKPLGYVYGVGLKVTDSFGEQNVAYATVTVVLSTPCEIVCLDPSVETDPLVCSAQLPCSAVASAHDSFGNPLATSCDPPGPYEVGASSVNVTCENGLESSTATCGVEVRDAEAPACQPLQPAPGSCHGPLATPVVVTAACTDNCGAPVSVACDPDEGGTECSYAGHGDWHVTVTGTDGYGNPSAPATVDFTIDTVPPVVRIVAPLPNARLAIPLLPISMVMSATDDDGAAGDVVHEVITIDSCVVYDGDTYGNGDGRLVDESIEVTVEELCRIAAQCGFTVLNAPSIGAEATDCGGNVGRGGVRLAGVVRLLPGLCSAGR